MLIINQSSTHTISIKKINHKGDIGYSIFDCYVQIQISHNVERNQGYTSDNNEKMALKSAVMPTGVFPLCLYIPKALLDL